MKLFHAFFFTFTLCAPLAALSDIHLESSNQKTHLLQLYTSEGCSSCPPADEWLSSQLSNPELFKTFIPMAFHVDYWNYIGWVDPFANSEFSKRQRLFKSQKIIKSVYTPGLIYANNEFWQWFSGDRDLTLTPVKAKKLTVDITNAKLSVNYESDETDLVVNVAYLKMNQKSDVIRGENKGRKFSHDFVVIEFEQFRYTPKITKKFNFLNDKNESAIAIWITKANRLESLQAVGSFL